MYTKEALRHLGVKDTDFTREQAESFDKLGYAVIENVLTPEQCREMADEFERIFAAEKGQGGHEVHIEPGARRVSNIFNKSTAFDACLELKPVLAASHHVLGEIKVHGANLRDPVQGYGQQALHVDVPKKFEDDWWVLNAVVLFDDMTLENGPTRAVPGSHYWAPINVPVVNQGDWEPTPLSPEDQARVPKDLEAPYPGEIMVTAPAGSVVLMNSSMWHSGTRKNDASPRRLLHLTYTRRDLPQQLVQLDHLTPELYERMSPEHRYLLEIEPSREGEGPLRQPKRDHKGWWN
jgi:ectoine hydroxylase-related dioxygenase (phytanoyl-CoA dioxygenase family)